MSTINLSPESSESLASDVDLQIQDLINRIKSLEDRVKALGG